MRHNANNKLTILIIIFLLFFSGISLFNNANLQSENEEYKNQTISLSENLKATEKKLSDREIEVRELYDELESYQNQEEKLDTLQKDYDVLKSKYDKLKNSGKQKAKSSNKSTNSNKSGGARLTGRGSIELLNSGSNNSSSEKTVYYTPNGEKYHSTESCSTLSRSKTIYSTTQSDAQSLGLDACKVCH